MDVNNSTTARKVEFKGGRVPERPILRVSSVLATALRADPGKTMNVESKLSAVSDCGRVPTKSGVSGLNPAVEYNVSAAQGPSAKTRKEESCEIASGICPVTLLKATRIEKS